MATLSHKQLYCQRLLGEKGTGWPVSYSEIRVYAPQRRTGRPDSSTVISMRSCESQIGLSHRYCCKSSEEEGLHAF